VKPKQLLWGAATLCAVDADPAAAIALLDEHFRAFQAARQFAERTGHSVPSDTKSWSEILVALLTGIPGRARKKGSDLEDGSDVKAANVWCAIDTPRFNGCAPAGRTSATSIRAEDISAFDDTPHLYFVLWDHRLPGGTPRCRIWVVSPPRDLQFRRVVASWYEQRATGAIGSTNFQLHPPRNRDDNVIRNLCGNLEYPLFFLAERGQSGFSVVTFDESAPTQGECQTFGRGAHR
jgi:MamI restriction endonuclease